MCSGLFVMWIVYGVFVVIDFYVFLVVVVLIGVVGVVMWIDCLYVLFCKVIDDLFCYDFVSIIILCDVKGKNIGFECVVYVWYRVD